MTDYEDLAFEPPLTLEGLKDWLKDKTELVYKDCYKFESEYSGLLFVVLLKTCAFIETEPRDLVFLGTPAQVKRVLEALLGD